LTSKASLNFPTSLIPNPPDSTGKRTLLQAIQVIFLPSEPQPHKKFDSIRLMALHTETGNLKNDK